MNEVKKFYVWQEAIALSKQLVRICEEFSDADRNALVQHLRQAVVEIPATVAADILQGRPATLEPAIRLATELELVHRIYPAIETGSAPEKLEGLLERMQSTSFNAKEPEASDESEEEIGQPAGPTIVQSEAQVPQTSTPEEALRAVGVKTDQPKEPRSIDITTHNQEQ